MKELSLMLAACVCLALVAMGAYAAGEPNYKVGWSCEFDDPADIEKGRLTQTRNWYGVSKKELTSEVPVKVESGVLSFGATFLPGLKKGEGLSLCWGYVGISPVEEPRPTPLDISIKDYPFLEIRWRVPKEKDIENINHIIVYRMELTEGAEERTAYIHPPIGKNGAWRVDRIRLAPDSSFPGPYTPRKIVGIHIILNGVGLQGPVGVEVDYIRLCGFTPEEAEKDKERVELFAGYTPPPIPERWRTFFPYGVYHLHSGLEFQGGWEGVLDHAARAHMNFEIATGHWQADYREVAAAGEPLGFNFLFFSQGCEPVRLENDWGGQGGIEAIKKNIEKHIVPLKDVPNIMGWFIVDEPYDKFLYGVAGVKRLLEAKDPDRLAFVTMNSLGGARYYERFSTIVWTDRYPLEGQTRDPWMIADWCRGVSAFSDRPHWFGGPQAFGSNDEYRVQTRTYLLPTVEEFRVMFYLALAKGVKGFAIFNWMGSRYGTGLVDKVGNPNPIMKEVPKIGEKLLSIGPLLLEARPILEHSARVETQGDGEHGVSVGAMGDAETGPVFLVPVNEDLAARQGARVVLDDAWVAPERAAYDLYGLKRVAEVGTQGFAVETLDPGEGRIYMLATEKQFADAREAIRVNAIQEKLRVQQADRVIAERWGLPLEEYQARVGNARKHLAAGEIDQAERDCASAAEVLANLMEGDAALAGCRETLLSVRKELGKALKMVYAGKEIVRPGQEEHVEPLEELCKRYGGLRGKYVRGEKASLAAEVTRLRQDVQSLVDEVK